MKHIIIILLLFLPVLAMSQPYTIQSESRVNSTFSVTFEKGDTVVIIRAGADNYFPSIGMPFVLQVPQGMPAGWTIDTGAVYSTQTQTALIGSTVKRFFDDKGQEWNHIGHSIWPLPIERMERAVAPDWMEDDRVRVVDLWGRVRYVGTAQGYLQWVQGESPWQVLIKTQGGRSTRLFLIE